ncbi:TetR/AcrR family transcriptional regulator [Actinomadura sp. ATCC 31491]|uniref:TetR/AcrR family transcriptional regulator n=1 Tax=Actinomadura luzonensis TaxID=2805427 RepID=A0ABT0G216_9ACTN|nr:TetR/AcrR family transcriptional regulator [Actinomadura luzonensis]MCK2218620.1 TetR/AcrR family transcriptional regulator [Actinomadura luzonensis]
MRNAGRSAGTREAILDAAERLFAEHGVAEVSSRRISEAAGQANHFAVGYHFGAKPDLVRALMRRYNADTEQRRLRMLDALPDPAGLRDWVSCLVRPATDHLDTLGVPTWRARCLAQITTVPALRRIVVEESVATPSMRRTLEGMYRLLPSLPREVHRERDDMSRLLVVHTLAERERALHEGSATARTSWEYAAIGLIDALAGLWLAPVTPLGT